MHVEKQRIAVRISMSGHDPLGGFLSLGPHSAGHTAYESLLELLNSAQRVIPFIQEDGQVILLTRANLAWVMAVERAERSLVVPADYVVVREETVELSFVNGTTIDGQIQIEETATGSRASDCLNAPTDFYPVKTRLGILLVNKARVCETRLSRVPKVENAEAENAREVVVEIDDADAGAVPPIARGSSPRPGIGPRKA